MHTNPDITDKGRLLFGAGFVFGVAFTMMLLAIVTSTVAGRAGASLMSSGVLVTITAGIFFVAVVGVSLFFLAFPENRLRLPRDLTGDGVELAAEEEP